MALDSEQWRRIYQIFDPTLRLEAGDMDLFVQRPDSASQVIAEEIQLGLEPKGKWVLCGSVGSGKSSELVRLTQLLGTKTHAPIGIDLTLSAARVDLLTPPEVLFLIGAGALRAAQELWNLKVPTEHVAALATAFSALLGGQGHSINISDLLQGVALFGANVLAPGAGAVVGAAQGVAKALGAARPSILVGKKKPQLGGLTRRLNEGEPDLVALQDAVNSILQVLTESTPIALVVDGLDKLQKLDVIRDLFATTRVLCSPEVPVIYSGPITLMLAAEWQGAGGSFKRARLPNIIVRKPLPDWVTLHAGQVEAGRAALRDVVARRLERRAMLPVDSVFEPDALQALISASGGLLRDLIHLVNRAVRSALAEGQTIIAMEAAAAAIEEIRKEYEITLNTRRVNELLHVREHGEPSGSDDVSKDLLLWDYVLPYANGKVWFEPHPILSGSRPGL